MDCEKYEPLLLDELYEELDELTSAAVKRHVSGCARCASQLSDMTATRRAVSLPLVPAPEGLEDRILAAAKEAQKVVPIRGRMSRALSVASTWAMRPQTAMAAVFLLMVGSSAILIRSKNYASSESNVSVTVAGAPAPVAAAPQSESLDDRAAAAAHGPTPPNFTRPPPPAASALAESAPDNATADRLAESAREANDDDSAALASALGEASKRDAKGSAPPAPIAMATSTGMANAGPGSDLPPMPSKALAAKRTGPADSQGQDPFSLGTAAFRARNFAEATRQYDLAAQSGDTNAALWAAESTREGQGCAAALGRYEALAQKAAGSWVGNEASLRAARCQIAMGQADRARERLNHLAQVPSHEQAAHQALAELNQAPSGKSGGGSAAGAVAAPKRAASPAPMRAPAAQEQKKSIDSFQ
ncbi:MAG TPA: hypothetical protein VM580_00400 [Labilithrix sp.]|nr:hypothetical protein [Labilithrix sp.]